MAGAVFWVGSDGNVYLKGDASVNKGATTNIGSASDNKIVGNGKGLESNTLSQSIQAQQIADPDPGPKTAPTATTPAAETDSSGSSGGSGSATTYDDKSNDIALQNAGLGAVDTQTAAGIAAINASLAKLNSQYDGETATNETNYTNSSNDNQSELQTNKQTALVNAANGRQGLLGALASIGALSGTGVEEANNAVQSGANTDLAGAGDTYATNQSSLDDAMGEYNEENTERKADAQTEADNAITNAQNQGATAKQTFLTNLSNDYSAEGNAGQAKTYTAQAAALYPTIAATNVPASTISAESAAYTPASLSNYLSSGNTIVNTSSPTTSDGNTSASLPGLTATVKKATTATAPVAVAAT
jgi:hypothetical protein